MEQSQHCISFELEQALFAEFLAALLNSRVCKAALEERVTYLVPDTSKFLMDSK